MRTTDEDDEVSPSVTPGRPGWMASLKSQAEEWLEALPKSLSMPHNDASPLARFFNREASSAQGLLSKIRKDLAQLKGACSGEVKQTNELRALMSDLTKGK